MIALALVAGLHCTAAAETWSLVATICADGDLAPLGEQYAQRLVAAARTAGWSLALQLDNGDERPSRRLLRAGEEVRVEGPVADGAPNLACAGTLTEFLALAGAEVPAERYAVVVFGHGASASGRGWDGATVGAWPALSIDVSAGGDALKPDELAEAIAEGLGGRAEIVVLDCCYGASLEVAWALREVAGLVVASPGRLRSTGLAWDAMLEPAGTSLGPEELALGWAAGAGQDLTVLRADRLEELRGSLRRLCGLMVERMPVAAPSLTEARSACPTWGSESEMCDLRALCAGVAAGSSGELKVAAEQTLGTIDRCVGLPGWGDGRGAVTVPFACGFGRSWPAVAPQGFGESSGWGAMIRAYHARLRNLMQRTDNDRRHDGAAT